MKQLTTPHPSAWYRPLIAQAERNRCIVMVAPEQHCTGKPVAYVVAMCEHDHLREGMHCARHLANLEAASCRACAVGTAPHDCPLTVLEVQHRRA